MANRTFFEFFAGGGMARLGLGSAWQCLLANDIDPKKVATYQANFGRDDIILGDIHHLKSGDMPDRPDLAWASFPCQDLSLAGNRAGLAGVRSGAFWGFWRAVNLLKSENRQPKLLVLENVIGTLSSHAGEDFRELGQALVSLGYDFGAVVIDAVHFLPQSRPRLFILCIKRGENIDRDLLADGPIKPWHSDAICKAAASLPAHVKSGWLWWKLPPAPVRTSQLIDVIQDDCSVASWHTPQETARLLSMMSLANLDKLREAQRSGNRAVGTVYKRTRETEEFGRQQRAEIRFDGIAGCLRTPGGGSSRQIVLIVDGKDIRSRLLTVREAARLMGVPDRYKIPQNYNEGYHVFGDGLAVPAVAFLREHLLDPMQHGAIALAKSAA